MKTIYAAAIGLLVSASASAADVHLCTLNTKFGYQTSPAQVRIINERGQVLTLSQGGLQRDGQAVKSSPEANAASARLEAALRAALPAAIEVSRRSVTLSLAGLSKDFYSRNDDVRWVPYVKQYRKATLQRYKQLVKSAPGVSIAVGGLISLDKELAGVGKGALSTAQLRALKPDGGDGATVAQDLETTELAFKVNEMADAPAKLCQQVRVVATEQAKAFAGTSLGSAFAVAVDQRL